MDSEKSLKFNFSGKSEDELEQMDNSKIAEDFEKLFQIPWFEFLNNCDEATGNENDFDKIIIEILDDLQVFCNFAQKKIQESSFQNWERKHKSGTNRSYTDILYKIELGFVFCKCKREERSVHELESKYNDSLAKVDAAGKNASKALNDSHKAAEDVKNATKDVLTLMGVFATIITVILSVVSTATSWLNNADGASAIIAFIVPTLVTVTTVVILLGIVLDENKTAKICMIIAAAILFLLAVHHIATNVCQYKGTTHTRYVISSDMYQIVPGEDSADAENRKVFVTFENVPYEFDWKDEYFHENDNLYFCEQHRILE